MKRRKLKCKLCTCYSFLRYALPAHSSRLINPRGRFEFCCHRHSIQFSRNPFFETCSIFNLCNFQKLIQSLRQRNAREQRPSVCQSDEKNRRQTPMASYGSDASSAEVSVRQLKSLTRSEYLTPDCKHRLFRSNKWPITSQMHRLSIYEAT